MRRRFIAAIVLPSALALAVPLAAQQQSSSQQNQPAPNAPAPQKPAQQQPSSKKKSESEQNPFPEAQSEAAAHPSQPQSSAPSAPAPQPDQSAPSAPAPHNGKPTAADQNPFPEAESESAQRSSEQQQQSADQKPGQSDGQSQPAAPDSGKSSDDYSSSHVKLLDLPGSNDTANPDAANGHNPTLAVKDTQVGMFYLKTGDYKGAYDRFAEAAKADPGNADAVFGLAESARRLNHRNEAIRNYQLYLSALPDGPRAKDARKALKDLGVNPNS